MSSMEIQPCNVCFTTEEFGRENELLKCVGCGLATHALCYDPWASIEVQVDWRCKPCSLGLEPDEIGCQICSLTDGLFTRTVDGNWAHTSCALWTPEVFFMDRERGDGVYVKSINKQRSSLSCQYCHRSSGAPIQCAQELCSEAAHPDCIMRYDVDHEHHCIVPLNAAQPDKECSYNYYCSRHHRNPMIEKRVCPLNLSQSLAQFSKGSIFPSFSPLERREIELRYKMVKVVQQFVASSNGINVPAEPDTEIAMCLKQHEKASKSSLSALLNFQTVLDLTGKDEISTSEFWPVVSQYFVEDRPMSALNENLEALEKLVNPDPQDDDAQSEESIDFNFATDRLAFCEQKHKEVSDENRAKLNVMVSELRRRVREKEEEREINDEIVYCCERVKQWKQVAKALLAGIQDQTLESKKNHVGSVGLSRHIPMEIRTGAVPSGDGGKRAIENAKQIRDEMERKARVQTEIGEDTVCSVCLQGDDKINDIIICDGCNMSAHVTCYGTPALIEGEKSDFFCDVCIFKKVSKILKYPDANEHVKCALCPVKHAGMKLTSDGDFVHLICAMWQKGVFIEDLGTMSKVHLPKIPLNDDHKCCFCEKSTGHLLRCDCQDCSVHYHFLCAWFEGCFMKAELKDPTFGAAAMSKHTEYPEFPNIIGLYSLCGSHSDEVRPREAQKTIRRAHGLDWSLVTSTPELPPLKGGSRGTRGGNIAVETSLSVARFLTEQACGACLAPSLSGGTMDEDLDQVYRIMEERDAAYLGSVRECTSCGMRTHIACHRGGEDNENWVCEKCSENYKGACLVCNIEGGTMARVSPNGDWAHECCSSFEHPKHSREATLRCDICKKFSGDMVHCLHEGCKAVVHPSCGAFGGFYRVPRENGWGHFCPHHIPHGVHRISSGMYLDIHSLRKLRSELEKECADAELRVELHEIRAQLVDVTCEIKSRKRKIESQTDVDMHGYDKKIRRNACTDNTALVGCWEGVRNCTNGVESFDSVLQRNAPMLLTDEVETSPINNDPPHSNELETGNIALLKNNPLEITDDLGPYNSLVVNNGAPLNDKQEVSNKETVGMNPAVNPVESTSELAPKRKRGRPKKSSQYPVTVAPSSKDEDINASTEVVSTDAEELPTGRVTRSNLSTKVGSKPYPEENMKIKADKLPTVPVTRSGTSKAYLQAALGMEVNEALSGVQVTRSDTSKKHVKNDSGAAIVTRSNSSKKFHKTSSEDGEAEVQEVPTARVTRSNSSKVTAKPTSGKGTVGTILEAGITSAKKAVAQVVDAIAPEPTAARVTRSNASKSNIEMTVAASANANKRSAESANLPKRGRPKKNHVSK